MGLAIQTGGGKKGTGCFSKVKKQKKGTDYFPGVKKVYQGTIRGVMASSEMV